MNNSKTKGLFWKDFALGFKSYGKAFKLLFTTKLWLFFFIPLVLNIILFYGGWELKDYITEFVKKWLFYLTNLENADFFMSEFLGWMLKALVTIIVGFFFLFIYAYFGGYIVLIVLSPVLAYLSEKVEKIETGNDYPFDFWQMLKDSIRGIFLAFRNMFIETGWMLAIFIIAYIPVVGWIAGVFGVVFLFFISAYFYGFSFIDYSIERRRLNIRQSVKLVRKRKGAAIAIGLIYAFVLLIPFIGLTVSGFFAIVSVVAGSISMNKICNYLGQGEKITPPKYE